MILLLHADTTDKPRKKLGLCSDEIPSKANKRGYTVVFGQSPQSLLKQRDSCHTCVTNTRTVMSSMHQLLSCYAICSISQSLQETIVYGGGRKMLKLLQDTPESLVSSKERPTLTSSVETDGKKCKRWGFSYQQISSSSGLLPFPLQFPLQQASSSAPAAFILFH